VISRSGILPAWLLIQILTLAFGAMRIPLWARSGTEAQHLAFVEMIAVQMTLGTLLFPILFDKPIALAAAISTLPFVQLAALLTTMPMVISLWVSLALLVWFGGLAAWRVALTSLQTQLVAVAGLSMLVLGIPVLLYLLAEFSDPADERISPFLRFLSPINSILGREDQHAMRLAIPVFMLASGVVAALIKREKNPAPSYPQTYSPPRRIEDQE
jgi:hypothetical protein